MKCKLLIVTAISFLAFVHVYPQEANAPAITIENRVGRITWLFADRAESSVVFYNFFKDVYDTDNELYEYNLNEPTEIEQMFIEMFGTLHKEFFDCYNNPDEEQEVVMGHVEEDQVTEFQLYILYTGFRLDAIDVNFVFIHNTANDAQALFCNIENFTGELSE